MATKNPTLIISTVTQILASEMKKMVPFNFYDLVLSTAEEDCIDVAGFFSDDIPDDSSSISGAALDEMIW
jgi:hypothetical protein